MSVAILKHLCDGDKIKYMSIMFLVKNIIVIILFWEVGKLPFFIFPCKCWQNVH